MNSPLDESTEGTWEERRGREQYKKENKTKAYPLNFLEYKGRIGLKIIRKVRERVT